MSDVKQTVTVEFDPELHTKVKFEDLDEPTRIAFAAMDTAYNVLRDAAVRVTLASLRTAQQEAGEDFPLDEELFQQAKESGIEGAPTSYRDLAPQSLEAAMNLDAAFSVLVEMATSDAVAGLFGLDDEG